MNHILYEGLDYTIVDQKVYEDLGYTIVDKRV